MGNKNLSILLFEHSINQWLRKVALFGILCLLVIFIFVYIYYFQTNALIDFPKEDLTSVLIVGDSHLQNGVNDQILRNSYNISASGESYLYSYIKLKAITRKNENIQTVLLGYSSHNLSSQIDENWIFNDNSIFNKVGSYYPLFDKNDIFQILRLFSSSQILEALNGILYRSIYSFEYQILTQDHPFIGGYTPNNKILKEGEIKYQIENKNTESKISDLQTIYLDKIKEYCDENNLRLILLNTPTLGNSKIEKIDFHKKEGITYIDWSDMNLESEYFADSNHLNPKGANFISEKLDSVLWQVLSPKQPVSN